MCIHISADLSQSSSVLDYICNPPIPSSPANSISHYCNTLQSPILQLAIYLYDRVHLALLRHLKSRTFAPQGPTGCHRPPNSLAPLSLDGLESNWNQ